jgi:Flp pilus assembly protein TadD
MARTPPVWQVAIYSPPLRPAVYRSVSPPVDTDELALAGTTPFSATVYHLIQTAPQSILDLRRAAAAAAGSRSAQVHADLGNAFLALGEFEEAIAQGRMVLEVEPHNAAAHNNLAVAYLQRGDFADAIAHLRTALHLDPRNEAIRTNLGAAIDRLVGSRPSDVALLNNVAWWLATDADTAVRNGKAAVQLAERAVQVCNGRAPAVLGTLAAAYAEAGRFPEAVQTARQALDLAVKQNNQALAESIKAKIPLYEAKTPFHESQ